MPIAISLSVHPKTQEEAAKAVESLSRVATGLAFDGMDVHVNITNYKTDED